MGPWGSHPTPPSYSWNLHILLIWQSILSALFLNRLLLHLLDLFQTAFPLFVSEENHIFLDAIPHFSSRFYWKLFWIPIVDHNSHSTLWFYPNFILYSFIHISILISPTPIFYLSLKEKRTLCVPALCIFYSLSIILFVV